MNSIPDPKIAITRDLADLASRRVAQALESVVQLTDTPQEAFSVALLAHSAVAGIMAAQYCHMTRTPGDKVDPTELAIAILQRLQVQEKRG